MGGGVLVAIIHDHSKVKLSYESLTGHYRVVKRDSPSLLVGHVRRNPDNAKRWEWRVSGAWQWKTVSGHECWSKRRDAVDHLMSDFSPMAFWIM